MRSALGVATLVLLAATPAAAQQADAAHAVVPGANTQESDTHRRILAARLQTRLEQIAADMPGVFGVQVLDLTNGERFGVNDRLVFPQGSAIKIAILLELYARASAGDLRVNETVRITRTAFVPGSQLQHFSDGASSMALHDLAVLMIIVSDNVATNLLIDRLGMGAINRRLASLGFERTRLQRKMIQPEQSARGNENLSTPQESAALMERIYRCDLPMTEAMCREMRTILDIPHGGAIQDAVPAGITVGQKTGSITGVGVNWGYIDLPGRPWVITAMGNYGETARINEAIREAAAAAQEYFSMLAGATVYGTRVPLRLLEPSRR